MKTSFMSWLTGIVLLISSAVSQAANVAFGDYELHYTAFPSTFIKPDVAARYDIERSSKLGLMNISVLKNGSPVTADVEIEVKNLLSQRKKLKPWLIDEGNAMYYMAKFRISNDELLHFTIRVKPTGSSKEKTVTFRKKFYED